MTRDHKVMHPIFNCNNMVDPIKKILLNHPKNAFINQKKIESIDNIIILSGSEKPSLTFLTQKINFNDGNTLEKFFVS